MVWGQALAGGTQSGHWIFTVQCEGDNDKEVRKLAFGSPSAIMFASTTVSWPQQTKTHDRVRKRCVHLLQFFNVCDHCISFPDSSRGQHISKGKNHGNTLGPNWWCIDRMLAEIGSHSTIAPNGITDPSKGIPNRLSYGVFPSDKRSWMFRRWQWHSMESVHHSSSRPDFNNTAEVPSFTLRTALSANPISLRSVWCRRAMIPCKIFTSFAEFQGIVSVNDFWFPLWFQELLQASLGFLGRFWCCMVAL